MKVSEAEVRILQELARGPLDTTRPCLETLAETLAPVFPDGRVARVRWGARDALPGEPLDASAFEDAPAGALYLLAEAPPEAALVLRLPQGSPPLDPRQRSLLRLAGRWLPAWAEAEALDTSAMPSRGSAVWIDAAGDLVRSDDVSNELLAEAGDLSALLRDLYREQQQAAPGGHVERAVELATRGVMLLRAEGQQADGSCLVTLEVLEPGSEAMFLARTRELSARETQIARLVQDSWGNKGIAQRLRLSPATVNMYLGKIYKKLEVKNRTELTRYLSGKAGG